MNNGIDFYRYIEDIGRAAHEINAAYCRSIGDHSQASWDDAPDWQVNSALDGVTFNLENPDVGPEGSHENWSVQMVRGGWVYGPVINIENKEHPCLVPFSELPTEQKAKEYLFQQIVHSLLAALAK